MSARHFYIMQSAVTPMQSEMPCYTPLTNHRTEVHTVPLVMADDYTALEAQRDKLARLLDEVTDDFVVNHLDTELIERIDAALASEEIENNSKGD